MDSRHVARAVTRVQQMTKWRCFDLLSVYAAALGLGAALLVGVLLVAGVSVSAQQAAWPLALFAAREVLQETRALRSSLARNLLK